jgi:hypothetical protein
MATTSLHTVIYNDKEYIIRIEKKPYLLDKTIQPVYNYYYIQEGNIKELLTYYTNGCAVVGKIIDNNLKYGAINSDFQEITNFIFDERN